MSKPVVYCIIVTYNGEKWIRNCLSSLANSTLLPYIFIIDNGSTDNTVAIVKAEYSTATLIQSPENLGFGQANNKGILEALKAGADYVFLLNQDAWVEENTIEKIVEIHQKNAEYGILSPIHINATHAAIDYNFSNYIVPRYCPDLYSDMYFNNLKDTYTCDFVNAAAWLISKECIQEVGLFDSVFFHYGEDRNYCQRVLFHGLKIGVCPTLTIVHDRERKGVTKDFQGIKEKMRAYLVMLADVNNNDFNKKYKRLLLKHLYNMTISAAKMNKAEYEQNSELYKFLKNKKQEIILSRKNNIKKYQSLTQ